MLGLRKIISPISNPTASLRVLWDSNKRWDEAKIINYFSDNRDVDESLKSISRELHVRVRKFDLILKNGQLSIKSAYKVLSNVQNQSNFESSSLNWKSY